MSNIERGPEGATNPEAEKTPEKNKEEWREHFGAAAEAQEEAERKEETAEKQKGEIGKIAEEIHNKRVEGKETGYTWKEIDEMLRGQGIEPGSEKANEFMKEWDWKQAEKQCKEAKEEQAREEQTGKEGKTEVERKQKQKEWQETFEMGGTRGRGRIEKASQELAKDKEKKAAEAAEAARVKAAQIEVEKLSKAKLSGETPGETPTERKEKVIVPELAGLAEKIAEGQEKIKEKLSFFKGVEDTGLEKTTKIVEGFAYLITPKWISILGEKLYEWQNKTGFGWESEKVENAAEQVIRKFAFLPALGGVGILKGLEKVKEKLREKKLSSGEEKKTKERVADNVEGVVKETTEIGEKAVKKAEKKSKLLDWIREKFIPKEEAKAETKPGRELTEMEKDKKTSESADKTWQEAHGAYIEALNENKPYRATLKDWNKADVTYDKAFRKSKLETRIAFQATPLGKKLSEKRDRASEIRNRAWEAFLFTPLGQELSKKEDELLRIKNEARRVFLELSREKPRE